MLVDLRERYLAQGFEVVGIAVDKADKVGEFAAKYQVSYPILVAESVGLDLMRKLGNGAGGLPFTVLLDRQGSVLNRKLGILRRKDIEPEIRALLSA